MARVTDSPLAAAALSWVALEASGIEYIKCRNLARALSLSAVRQQLVDAHKMISLSIAASIRYYNAQVKILAGLIEKNKATLKRVPVDYVIRREEANAALAASEIEHAQAVEKLRTFTDASSTLLAALNKYVEINLRYYLVDLNRWVDVLLPSRASDGADCSAAREALASILPYLTPLASRQIVDWQQRLRSPKSCSEWILLTQWRMETLLRALYSARNLALHSGVFTAAGDVVLGRGGVMLADFTVETLGYWYRNADQTKSGMMPFEIVDELASRQERIIQRLSSHPGPIYELDMEHLTGPVDSDAWNRT
jgi:hypothetical protein